jgi:hypothetical protein
MNVPEITIRKDDSFFDTKYMDSYCHEPILLVPKVKAHRHNGEESMRESGHSHFSNLLAGLDSGEHETV